MSDTENASGAQVPCISLLAQPLRFPPLPKHETIMGITIIANSLLPPGTGMLTDGKTGVIIRANAPAEARAARRLGPDVGLLK